MHCGRWVWEKRNLRSWKGEALVREETEGTEPQAGPSWRPLCSRHSPSAAEVQLHSGQEEQAEMGQLREQLIGAFHEQMDVRRRLLELENQAMEVQIDTSRHLLTIARYARPYPGTL